MAGAEILDKPFFTLEYDEEKACLIRRPPPGAEDLGGGEFRFEGRLLALPPANAETKILEREYIRGKDILTLARRAYNHLVKSGPLIAGRGDRLMEMCLPDGSAAGRGKNEKNGGLERLEIILRDGKVPRELWRPLEGLPNYFFRGGKIYEVPDAETEALFSPTGKEKNEKKLLLRGEEIPSFADNHARLIYVFADKQLYKLLAQEEVFVRREEISLVLYCAPFIERAVGKPVAVPALKYRKELYSAIALSRRFRRKYLPLSGRWIRRETLEQIGIGPLGRFVNGEPLRAFPLKAGELLSGGGMKLLSAAEFSGGLELDKDRWVKHGTDEEIFRGHLDFLRAWGISGGIITGGREKAASFLAAWLFALADEAEKETRAEARDFHDEGPMLFDDSVSCENGVSGGGVSSQNLPRVLVLVPKPFWARLSKELERSGEGRVKVKAHIHTEAGLIWTPSFRGTGIGTYSDLAAFTENQAEEENSPPRKQGGTRWDIILAAGLDECSDIKNTIINLEAQPARLRLGIFFGSRGAPGSSVSESLKTFFGIKGGLKEFEKYLIREDDGFLSLPAPPPAQLRPFLRPPKPWEGETEKKENLDLFDQVEQVEAGEWIIRGGGRFSVETKFSNLSIAAFRLEQEEFFDLPDYGAEAEFSPPEKKTDHINTAGRHTELPGKYTLLSKKEKNFFLHWRACFRGGRILETHAAFVLIYARELILRMDAAKKNASPLPEPEKTFEELRRLWLTYGTQFPNELKHFPGWLLDFSLVYNTAGAYLPETAGSFPVKRNNVSFHDLLLTDLYLHKKYVEENHALLFSDFFPLLETGGSLTEETEKYKPLEAAACEALNTADRTLRKNYGKKLLEFFYPLPPANEQFTLFEGLEGIGNTVCRAEWLSFSRHKPFVSFLSSLTAFLDHRVNNGNHPEKNKKAPYMEEAWQYICGFRENVSTGLDETEIEELRLGKNAASSGQGTRLETEKINRLREESDAVMEMLKTENPENNFYGEKHPNQKTEPSFFSFPHVSDLRGQSPGTNTESVSAEKNTAAFIAALDQNCLEFLELLSRGADKKELDSFARENGVMTDFIIDKINEKFLVENGDLLIDYRVDEGAVIGEEYRDEVLWALTFQNV